MNNPLNHSGMSNISITPQPPDYGSLPTFYRVIAELVQEDEEDGGGYSAIALNLDGACGEGETEADALSDLKDSAEGIIEYYKYTRKQEIPWLKVDTSQLVNGREVMLRNG